MHVNNGHGLLYQEGGISHSSIRIMTEEHFYGLLGRFLYALSMSDGMIQPGESKAVEDFVRDELFSHPADAGNIAFHEIILTKLNFFHCMKEKTSLAVARDEFEKFCIKYCDKISKYQQELAGRLIHKVATAYKGMGSAEEKLVKEFNSIFQLP